MNSKESALVIYVEDDEDDQELCRIALEDSKHDIDLQFFGNGESAIAYIDKIAGEPEETWPKLFLLDLSMPATNGWDILNKLRSHDSLHAMPLVVFTTSNSPVDRNKALRQGANAYMVKPAGLQELTECFDITFSYWLKIASNTNNV